MPSAIGASRQSAWEVRTRKAPTGAFLFEGEKCCCKCEAWRAVANDAAVPRAFIHLLGC